VALFVGDSAPAPCYVFPARLGAPVGRQNMEVEVFVFQYWPESVEDTYNVDYGIKQPAGGSHPLYQWTGGSGRDITFTAQFTSEFQVERDSAPSPYNPASGFIGVLPSQRYTVDIIAALNRIRSYMLPKYDAGGTQIGRGRPPARLYLILEHAQLGGDRDEVLCILRAAPITYESFWPSGKPRIVQVAMTFSEVVQHGGEGEGSKIQFIDRSPFERDSRHYLYRGTIDRAVGGY
jgi:hypothetical protein